MCEVLDRIENRGRDQEEARIILNMHKKGLPLEQIAELIDTPLDQVKTVVEKEKKQLS